MARLNVYLPDELAAEAKAAGLNLSAVTQEAVRRCLGARSTDGCLRTLGADGPNHVTHQDALKALDAVREDAPTRHG